MSGTGEAALIAIGMVAGLAAALVLVLVWTIHAGPLAERMIERFEKPTPGSEPEAVAGLYGVLVSDLHLDTWDFEAGETHVAFTAFLDWVRRSPRIGDLYINGDIMDVPPHPSNQRDVTTLRVRPDGDPMYPDLAEGELGVLQDRFEPVLEALGQILARDHDVPPLRVTYLTGNHDLGLSGLRYLRPNLAWTSFKALWNPSVCIERASGREVYFEHGHRVDPYLWLYLRYAALELVRGPMPMEAQRGGKVGMGPHAASRDELRLDALTPQPWEVDGPQITPAVGESAATKRARYRYRHAARRLFRQLPSSVRTVTMGHTHIPDRYTFPDGRVYLNSGDWAGNTPHRCFLIVHPSGQVTGPHQWRSAAEADALLHHGADSSVGKDLDE